MPYAIGIDLGSGRTTAAISRNDRERWLEPEVVALDGDPAGVVSVMHVTDDGAVEVGGSALRALPARADWVARDVAARVGDEIPIMLGGAPYPAEVLTAAAVGWVVDYVEALEGTSASQLVVTHPAAWGMRRRALLLTALREVNLPDPTLLPRPVAIAEAHASTQRVEVGEQLAVLSVGAGRPESAVLRRGPFGFEPRSHGEGVEEVCGDLFDDLLTEHVLSSMTSAPEWGTRELAELRVACTSAKERLSCETSVSVAGVEVSRAEFEELIRSAVDSAVESLSRTIQAGGEVTTVVVAGGSARIPLVRELVGARTRARVVVAAPETSVAMGAAAAAAKVAKPTVRATAVAMVPEPIPRTEVTHTDLMRLDDLPEQDLTELGPPPPRPPVEIAPLEPPRRRLLSRRGPSPDSQDSREGPESPDLVEPGREFADLALPPREERRPPRRHPRPAPADHHTDFQAPPRNRPDRPAATASDLAHRLPVTGGAGSMAPHADRARELFTDTAVDHRRSFEPARHRGSEQPRHQPTPPAGSPWRGADTEPDSVEPLAAGQDAGDASRTGHAAAAAPRRHRYREDAFEPTDGEGGRHR
jgi:cell division ATPase FtsA